MANEAEHRRWNNPEQVASWVKREGFTDRVMPYVIGALRPSAGERILEIGPGGGKLSLAVGEIVGRDGRVVGADISAGMVKWATQRAEAAGTVNVAFLEADVQSGTIPGGPFDAVISQFGVMFFDEPVVAFSNIRRQLNPGGRMAFVCWQPAARNLWHTAALLSQFTGRRPELPPGKSPTGPFSMGNARRIRQILTAAGFTEITRTRQQLIVVTPEDSVRDEEQVTGISVPSEQREAARAALARHFEQFRRGDGLSRFELNFQVVTARNPRS